MNRVTNRGSVLRMRRESAHQIHHQGNAEVLGGAGAGLDRSRAQGRRTPLGENHSIDASPIGDSQQDSQILRILDPVQRQQQPGAAGGRQGLKEVLDGQEFLSPDHGDHTLVGGCAGNFRQLLARFLADTNPASRHSATSRASRSS